MRNIGYMRVSTKKQDETLQKDSLEKYGCDKIFMDKVSGKIIHRQGLDECLSYLQSGDTLVVWKIDRLGRRVSHLSRLIEELSERQINFISITDNFDTSTVMGRAMLGIMCVFAQMERETIGERVRAGLEVRKSKGLKLGPHFKLTEDDRKDIMTMYEGGMSQGTIAANKGISQGMVSRVVRGIS